MNFEKRYDSLIKINIYDAKENLSQFKGGLGAIVYGQLHTTTTWPL